MDVSNLWVACTNCERMRNRFKRNQPEISVIIPFLNVDLYIEKCLESVINQEGVHLEIILVDDGSTDKSLEIVRRFMEVHKNIKLYTSKKRGPGAARNCGVKYATGEYIAFVDADDVLSKDIYYRMLSAMRKSGSEVCICNSGRVEGDSIYNSDLHDCTYKNYSLITHITKNHNLIYDSCVWNKLIKRRFYSKKGMRFPEGVIYEDIVFNAQLHMWCNHVTMIAETGYLWRHRRDGEKASLSQEYYKKKNIHDRIRSSGKLLEFLKNNSAPKTLLIMAKYKLLERDLKIILDSVNYLSEKEAGEVFVQIQQFIDDNIEREIINMLPVVDIQRYKYVKNGNVAAYKELLKYRNGGYNRAPIIEINNRLLARLPKQIINVDNHDVTGEFACKTRRTWVDSIEKIGDDIEIKAHIYIRRYDMANQDSQTVTVKLVNEETLEIITVTCKAENTSFLTKKFGKVYDEITDTYTNYNYDYTGFSFRIKEALKDTKCENKKKIFSVIAEYKDRLFSGRQILKGVDECDIECYKNLVVHLPGKKIGIEFGLQRELQLIIESV